MDVHHKIVKLKNGIKILYIPFLKSKLVKIKVKVLHGEINENKKTAEFGHLLEHMNAKFTSRKYPNAKENSEKINNVGGNRNASITDYFTEYYIAGSIKHYDVFMDLILNSVLDFKFDNTVFDQEKQSVIEELHSIKSDPWNKLNEKTNDILYKNHPYAIKYDERIKHTKNTKINEVIKFRKQNYTTTNTLLIVAGDIQLSKIMNSVHNTISKLPKNVYKQNLPSYKFKLKQHVLFVDTKTESAKVYLRFNIPYTYFKKQADNIIELKKLLTSGYSSRLYVLRREHGLIYSISCSCSHDFYNTHLNTFTIVTKTNSKNVTTIIRIILDELHKLKTNKISDNELQRLKNNIMIEKLEHKMNQNMGKYINFYSKNILFDKKVETYKDYYKSRNQISKEKIQDLSNVIFDNRKILISYGGSIKHDSEINQILKTHI
jgi:predicted Zn-dependent peptidase